MSTAAIQNGVYVGLAYGNFRFGFQLAGGRERPRRSAQIIDVSPDHVRRSAEPSSKLEPIAGEGLPQTISAIRLASVTPAVQPASMVYRPASFSGASASLIRQGAVPGQFVDTLA